MRRHGWQIVVAVTMAGWLGCGSAEQGGQSGQEASMDEMAAVLAKPQAASGGGATRPNEPAPPAERSAAAKPTPKVDASLPSRRGFALFDLSNEAAYVLVKTDADKVAAALAKQSNGTVTKDALGKSPGDEEGGTIVFQLNGHPWSVFALDPDEKFDAFAGELSKELGADVLTFANSDFSGWSFVSLFRNGEEVEALSWGEDLSELGAGPNPSEWDILTTVSTDHGDDIVLTDQWLFRSSLRTVTEQDVQKGEAFNDELFKLYDAYLPDVEDMPWVGEGGNIESPLGAAAFKGVHLVIMPTE